MKKLNRREFLRLSALGMAGAAMAACAPKATTVSKEEPPPAEKKEEPKAAPPPDPVTIQYWVFWGQYERAFPSFNEELQELVAPNKVDVKWGQSRDEVFLPNIAAGTPPDLGAVGGSLYNRMMMRGVVVPIDDLVAASSVIAKDNFVELPWKACFYEGKQYGFPAIEGFVPCGFNYNAKMVEEAGLDPDNPPTTWGEGLEWHKALTKFDDAGNLLQIGLDPYDAVGGGLDFMAASWGFDYWDPETNEFNIDNEEMAQSFDVMGEYVKIIGPDNLAGFRQVEGQGTWGGAYNMEVQALIHEGYWHPGETFNEKPDVAANNRATWMFVSDARKGTKVTTSASHQIQWYKDAKVPADVAWPVGEFLVSDVHMDAVFQHVGWLCPYFLYIEKADPSVYPGLEFYFRSIKEADEMPQWVTEVNPIGGFVRQQVGVWREKVYRDEMTGKEAAAEFHKACLQEWEEQGLD